MKPVIGVGRAAFGTGAIRSSVFQRVKTLRADAIATGSKSFTKFAFPARPKDKTVKTSAAHYDWKCEIRYYSSIQVLGNRIGNEVNKTTQPHPHWNPVDLHASARNATIKLIFFAPVDAINNDENHNP